MMNVQLQEDDQMQIFIGRNGQQSGPYSEADVSRMVEAKQIDPNDLAWHEGLSNWTKVSAVLEGPIKLSDTAAPTQRQAQVFEKSLPLAIGLNILWPGLGYIYMGKWIAGLIGGLLIIGIYATMGLIFLPMTWITLSAIMALDMAVLSGRNKRKIAERTTMKCPNCAETIQREAKVCRFCTLKIASA
jgi:GYF domain 2